MIKQRPWGLGRWFRVEFRLRNPWALLIQGLFLLLFGLMLYSLLRYMQPLTGIRVGLAVSLTLACVLWVVQMRFTAKAGSWYGNSWVCFLVFIAPGIFFGLPVVTDFSSFMEWFKSVAIALMLIVSLREAWFDYVQWPREASQRGLALDAPEQR